MAAHEDSLPGPKDLESLIGACAEGGLHVVHQGDETLILSPEDYEANVSEFVGRELHGGVYQ